MEKSNGTSLASEFTEHLRIAVIGSQDVGKSTVAGNFLKGNIPKEDEKELNIESLMNPDDGIYEVDLDYNSKKYHIEIQEQNLSNARNGFLDDFDGVIYMFA